MSDLVEAARASLAAARANLTAATGRGQLYELAKKNLADTEKYLNEVLRLAEAEAERKRPKLDETGVPAWSSANWTPRRLTLTRPSIPMEERKRVASTMFHPRVRARMPGPLESVIQTVVSQIETKHIATYRSDLSAYSLAANVEKSIAEHFTGLQSSASLTAAAATAMVAAAPAPASALLTLTARTARGFFDAEIGGRGHFDDNYKISDLILQWHQSRFGSDAAAFSDPRNQKKTFDEYVARYLDVRDSDRAEVRTLIGSSELEQKHYDAYKNRRDMYANPGYIAATRAKFPAPAAAAENTISPTQRADVTNIFATRFKGFPATAKVMEAKHFETFSDDVEAYLDIRNMFGTANMFTR